MPSCPLCNTRYPDGTSACEIDGTSLMASATRTASVSVQSLDSRNEHAAQFPATVSRRPAGKAQHMGLDSMKDSELTAAAQPGALAGRARSVSNTAVPRIASGSGTVAPDASDKDKWSKPFFGENPGLDSKKSEDWIGQTLGSYKLLSILGKGGMGCVFKAEHIKLGREVALKVLRADYAKRKDAVARFFQEARAVNKIRHRNIVDITDLVELEEGTVFIIMEYLDGLPLSKIMRATVKEEPDNVRILNILIQICDGLTAAHSVGIVHRDLKPDNIVITKDYEGKELVTLLDFGVAKLLEKKEGDDIGLMTVAGSVVGTPAFMSPEQAGGLQVDGRADIYSLGAIMYEMFAKQPLFRGKSFKEFVRLHLNEMPVTPSKTKGGANIDPAVEATIMMCLQKSPNARFQSAKQLRADLLSLLSSFETSGELTGHLANLQITASPVGAASPLATGVVSPNQLLHRTGQIDSAEALSSGITPPLIPTNPIQPSVPVSRPADAQQSEPGYAELSGQTSQPGYSSIHGQTSQQYQTGHTGQQTQHSRTGQTGQQALHQYPTGQAYSSSQSLPLLSGTQGTGQHSQSSVSGTYPSQSGYPVQGAYAGNPSHTYNLNHTPPSGMYNESQAAYDTGMRAGKRSNRIYLLMAGAGLGTMLLVMLLVRSPSDSSSLKPKTTTKSAKVMEAEKAKEPIGATQPPAIANPAANQTLPKQYQIRLNSIPGAKLYAAGTTVELCTSPCDLVIDLQDGLSRTSRQYRFEAPGFLDTTITLDLTLPNEPRSFPMAAVPSETSDTNKDNLSESGDKNGTKSNTKRNNNKKRNNKDKRKPKCKVGASDTFNPFGSSKDCR